MKTQNWWMLVGGLMLTGGLAAAQPEPTEPLFHKNFEDGAIDPFIVFPLADPNADANARPKASVTQQPENVKEGKAALQFDYSLEKGKLSALIVPTPGGVPVRVKSFRFWIKADYGTSLALVMEEQGGGRYVHMFAVPKDTWQRVEVSPAEFTLMQDKDSPLDPDGKLDLKIVQMIALGDINQLLIQNEMIAQLLGIKAGPHTFYLDDFQVSEETLPAATAPEGAVNLDAFVRPQLNWMATGGIKLSRAEDQPLGGPALQADYQQAQRITGLVKWLPQGKLAGMSQLTFQVAAKNPTTLLVQLEETSGGKYNAIVDVPGNAQVKEAKLAFADFKVADDSKDDNNRLDLEQVKQVLLLDLTGLMGLAEGDNTLWINQLRVAPK